MGEDRIAEELAARYGILHWVCDLGTQVPMATPPYHQRTLSRVLRSAARSFPALVVTGSRQAGKSTLVQHVFGSTHRYCALDDPAIRAQAAADPRRLFSRFPPPVILDEIQYVPDLLRYLKADIDEHRGESGRYVLTGSQSFPLMRGVSESLAGRVAVSTLLSMSLRESLGHPDDAASWTEVLSRTGKRAA